MGTGIGRTVKRGAACWLAAAGVAQALVAQALVAQAQPVKVTTLSGVVTNPNGVAIARAELLIVNSELKVMSNDSGVYEFFAVPVGRIRLIARRIGFEPEEARVTLNEGMHKQVDFELTGVPELLDSVMVREAGGNGRMADFWARRMLGVGAFITRAEIERRRPQHPSDLLRTVVGVKVTMGDAGLDKPTISMGRNTLLSRSGRQTGTSLANDCKVSYYVDGSYVPPGTFHMDDMSALLLEAIEIYRGPAETPARLRQRDTACGVIVIWTREPPQKQSKRPPAFG